MYEDEPAATVFGTGPRPAAASPGESAASTLPELFERQVRLTPENVAVSCAGRSVTYRELNARANRLAHLLIARGAGPERLVALLLPRSIELVVAVLAVLKTGAGYLPIDPGYPRARITFMVDDAKPACAIMAADQDRGDGLPLPAAAARIVLGDPDTARLLDEQPDRDPRDSARTHPLRPMNTAYVIYTSGSTGRPKGVLVPHHNVLRLLAETEHWFGFCAEDVWSLCHSYAFDFSVWELWGALAYGGRLVVVPLQVNRTPRELLRLLVAERVTVLNQTPSAFYQLMRDDHETPGLGDRLSLRLVIFGGEALDPDRLSLWCRRHPLGSPALVNMYGITETTVHVSYAALDDEILHQAGSRIGRSIPDLLVYVLDDDLTPVPPGVAGEMYVSGAGLARGYLGRPGLTAERFVADPFRSGGARMYRTGDLARYDHGGALDYLGRTDDQVKIRGFRVELGEIEAALVQRPQVAQAAVLRREDQPGDARLVAYVVPAGAHTTALATDLRAQVASTLPDHMVPAAVVVLDALPLTINGKLDRSALPAPDYAASGVYQAPRFPREQVLCEIFGQVLGVARVGVHDSFLDLGGHSLLAARLISRVRAVLGAELDLRALFDTPTVAGLVDRLTPSDRPVLTPRTRPARVPLSSGQQRLWFVHRTEPSAAYNVPLVLRMAGHLDRTALVAAVGDVVARHEPLRTVFPEDAGVPFQEVAPSAQPWTRIVEVGRADLDASVALAVGHVFDLATETPLRASLFAVSPSEHVLLLLFHHIAVDGVSMSPLLRDLGVAYQARAAGGPPNWSPLPVQYADYTLWQRELCGDRADDDSLIARQLEFWRSTLAGIPQELSLPADRPRPAAPTRRGATVRIDIEPRLHRGLAELATATRTTLPMVLQAGVAVLLSRLGAGTDIPIGTSVAGRADEALNELVGYFVNTLVLRTDTSGDPSFRQLLARIRTANLAAYVHQDVPFDQVVGDLNPIRSASVHPLFQVIVDVADDDGAGTAWPAELLVTWEWAHPEVAKFDLEMMVYESRDEHGAPAGVTGTVEYATDLFDASTVELLTQRLIRLLDAVVDTPDHPVGAVELLSPDELRRVLLDYNATRVPDQGPTTVHELFDEQARRFPDRIAASCCGDVLTYAQLTERANQVARRLTAAGVRSGDVVGVLLRRSLDLVVGTLAVLKAGAAYAPLTGGRPPAQVRTIMRECGASTILIDAHHGENDVVLAESAHGTGIVRVDEPPAPETPAGRPVAGVDPAQLAYIMFTSGSTGRPKGVSITHGNVVELVRDTCWRMENHERVLVHSAYGFDASTYEMWLPLLSGTQVVIAPADAADVHGLAKVIEQERVTAAYFTTGLFNIMADECVEAFGRLRETWTSGDVASAAAIQRVLDHSPDITLVHGYGPTETTVWCSYQPLEPPHSRQVDLTLGVPMTNTRMYVLDENLRPVPLGGVGELYVAGSHLARGYIGAPGLTAARFVADPISGEGERMYRTGDLVRWTSRGALKFVGRVDGQVKIRGIRVEPGEIEGILGTDPSVGQVAVLAREERPGDRRLVAYVVPADGGGVDTARLRRLVASVLPDYMVPAGFVELGALPLTVNGKLDRAALPAPEYAIGGVHRAPRTPQEEVLCGLFADVLGLPRFGVDDDFFELGGDSLLAVRLVARIRATMNADLDLRLVFQNGSTIATLIGHLKPLGAQLPTLRQRARAREES